MPTSDKGIHNISNNEEFQRTPQRYHPFPDMDAWAGKEPFGKSHLHPSKKYTASSSASYTPPAHEEALDNKPWTESLFPRDTASVHLFFPDPPTG